MWSLAALTDHQPDGVHPGYRQVENREDQGLQLTGDGPQYGLVVLFQCRETMEKAEWGSLLGKKSYSSMGFGRTRMQPYGGYIKFDNSSDLSENL